MDTRELIEERVRLHEECKLLLDRAAREKRTLTPSEQQDFDRKDIRVTELRRTIDAAEKVNVEERALGESRGRKTFTEIAGSGDGRGNFGPSEFKSDADLALRAWALGNRASTTMLDAAARIGIRPGAPELELRALSAGNTSAGGYSVPDEMMRAFVEAEKWYGRVENLATVFNTSTGAPLPIPKVDDTANTGEIIDEAAAVTTTADPVFSQTLLHPFKYSSKAVIVSVELLQDSFINLPQYLGRALGTRIGRIKNTHFTTGGGTTTPWGVVTRASLGKTAAATNAITFDEVIDLLHSVDPAYRARPGAGFMMHDTIASYVRKLKDSEGRYLWELGLQAGMPDRILGYPVTINSDMASTQTTTAKVMLFGDFASYTIQNAGPVTFIRDDSIRVLAHQSCFLAFQRSDGDLPDTTAVKYLRNA